MKNVYEFGGFWLDPEQEVLLSQGVPVALPPKAFETLRVLVERRGTIVSKQELLSAVWPGAFVEENNLSQCISLLRKTLGDDRHSAVYIETVARRGYRFRAVPETPVGSQPDISAAAGRGTPAREGMRWLRLRPGQFALLAACLIAAAALGGWRWAVPPPLVQASATPVSLAVLPYEIGDEPPPQYLSNAEQFAGLALADDMGRQLNGRSTSLRVLPISAVYRYAPGGMEYGAAAEKAARAMGANFAVAVRMEYSGDSAVLRVRLLRGQDGSAVWTRVFRGDRQHMFALQDKMAAALQKALLGRVSDGATPHTHITESLRAYGAFAGGRMLWSSRTSEGIYQSIDLEQQATNEDPKFAMAYAALADAYAFDMIEWHKSEDVARKALALDPKLAEAHASLGLVQMLWRGNYESAATEFRTAIQLNPAYAGAHEWYSDNFAAHGRTVEAFHEMRTALDLDPSSLPVNTDMARLMYLTHNFDDARRQSLHALALDRKFLGAHVVLHDTLIQQHEYDKAMAEFVAIENLAGTTGLYPSAEAQNVNEAYTGRGIQGFFQARAEYFSTKFRDDYQKAKYLALMGRKDESVAALRQAEDRNGPNKLYVMYASSEPVFDGLHNDPKFRRAVGLD